MIPQLYPIKNISDTARWMAYYRAVESERPDAHFHDSHARLLAGERGEEIARVLPWGISSAWSISVRTCIFDEIILKTVESRAADTILNLAAGFDTRPYRLSLPSSLRWVEVDLPEILAEKEEKLVNEQPKCCLQRIQLDLADIAARRSLFSRLNQEALRVLVLTEGLLVYLKPGQVAELAYDLHANSRFLWWLTDLISPQVLRLYQICWASKLANGNASWEFAPAEGERFFSRRGWDVAEFRSTMEEASRLNREMPFGSFWRMMASYATREFQESYRKMSCSLLLERA